MGKPQAAAMSNPWYQAVAITGFVQAPLTSDQVRAVLDGLQLNAQEVARINQEAGTFRKLFRASTLPPHVPPRWLIEVAPLLRVLAEDAKPGTPIEVRADLRSIERPEFAGAKGQIAPTRPNVKKVEQTLYMGPWCDLKARLADGSRVSVTITDRVRKRDITKRGSSGKIRHKVKRKVATRIDVEVSGDAALFDLAVPDPPPRFPIFAKPSAERPTVTARLDLDIGDGTEGQRVIPILHVLTDAHRHLRPKPGTAA